MPRIPRRVVLFSVVGLLLPACGGTKQSKVPDVHFSAWEGEMRDLFNDEINPSAVGLSVDGGSPAADPRLRRRAEAAELVARLRVQTVTRDSVGAKVTYVLGMQVGVPPLLPTEVEDGSVELSITPESTAFAIVQRLENSLRGKTFIGLVRRFSGKDGPVWHWHLTADSAEVAQVIEEVAVMEELAGE
jgi:hypothetical protein